MKTIIGDYSSPNIHLQKNLFMQKVIFFRQIIWRGFYDLFLSVRTVFNNYFCVFVVWHKKIFDKETQKKLSKQYWYLFSIIFFHNEQISKQKVTFKTYGSFLKQKSKEKRYLWYAYQKIIKKVFRKGKNSPKSQVKPLRVLGGLKLWFKSRIPKEL